MRALNAMVFFPRVEFRVRDVRDRAAKGCGVHGNAPFSFFFRPSVRDRDSAVGKTFLPKSLRQGPKCRVGTREPHSYSLKMARTQLAARQAALRDRMKGQEPFGCAASSPVNFN